MLAEQSRKKKRIWKERSFWWSVWAEVGRPPGLAVAPEEGMDAVEQWTRPEWEEVSNGCRELRFDFVWTIS